MKTARGTAGGFLHLIQIRFPLPVLDLLTYERTPSGRERGFCARSRASRQQLLARVVILCFQTPRKRGSEAAQRRHGDIAGAGGYFVVAERRASQKDPAARHWRLRHII